MKINSFSGFDASGRPFDPKGVIYTAVDMQGMYVDALIRGDFSNAEIVEYRWDDQGTQLFAVVRDRHNDAISIYAMDVMTGKPYRVNWPPNGPFLRKKKRPRESRDMKVWRATKKWEER